MSRQVRSGSPLSELGISVQASPEADLELTILLPCLNERETLETCIRKALAFLERHQIRGEVLVSDNGSEDGSQEVAWRCGARVVDVPVRRWASWMFDASLHFIAKLTRNNMSGSKERAESCAQPDSTRHSPGEYRTTWEPPTK